MKFDFDEGFFYSRVCSGGLLKKIIVAVFSFILLFPVMGQALLVLKLNLVQLSAFADRIFVGECISVRQGRDSNNYHVNYVTYRVDEMLKGESSKRVTFKQLVPPPPSEQPVLPDHPEIKVTSAFADMPRYQVGATNVVFLSEDSEVGLTAPVGLHQGMFRVFEEGVQKQVVNRVGNKGLFVGIKKSPLFKGLKLSSSESKLVAQEGSPLSYDSFVSLVQKIVEAQSVP